MTVTQEYSIINQVAEPERMRTQQGLSCIRRANGQDHIYFISNLQDKDIDEWVTMGKAARFATFYNPMNGDVRQASITQSSGLPEVRMQLLSGESIIVYLTDTDNTGLIPYTYINAESESCEELKNWTLRFIASAPTTITKTYQMDTPKSWTELGEHVLNETMATGLYATEFKCKDIKKGPIILDLGDVRETARVRLNSNDVATLFAVPYRVDITPYVKKGKNKLEIEVSNLGANRISKLDREGVEWRKFNEINVVDLNYKNTRYDQWTPMPSGLCSPVRLLTYAPLNP